VQIGSGVRRVAILTFVTFAFVAGAPTQIESALWWRSPRFVVPLQLTSTQASAIDEIYRRMLPERLERAAEADAARVQLERLLDSDGPDEELEWAASRAADADAARRRLRTLMLYRMSRVLTSSQRSQFTALAEKRHHVRRTATP
jgi:Spy/CpxP family protein refolding chaperone